MTSHVQADQGGVLGGCGCEQCPHVPTAIAIYALSSIEKRYWRSRRDIPEETYFFAVLRESRNRTGRAATATRNSVFATWRGLGMACAEVRAQPTRSPWRGLPGARSSAS